MGNHRIKGKEARVSSHDNRLILEGFFRPRDFSGVNLQTNPNSTSQFGPTQEQAERLAERANELLRNWLTELPRVCKYNRNPNGADRWEDCTMPPRELTRHAFLVEEYED